MDDSQEEVPIPQEHEILNKLTTSEELTPEQRAEITSRFSGLVSVIGEWAQAHEVDISDATPLGGGFKNPVLMITTSRGEQFVAKGFTEKQALETTKKAQATLDELTEEDIQLIPKSEIFSDTLFSEKAKGSPIKTLIKEAVEDPSKKERAMTALSATGATLGMIHERTERHIDNFDDLSPDQLLEVESDTAKALRHIDELATGRLTGISPEVMERIKERVIELTKPEYLSLVHGDAHLDQFFHEDGGATVEIVDYDDIREGDPMADLGRLIASQRDWCAKYGVSPELEMELTRAVVRGYETTRRESRLDPEDDELDVMRVVAYELRLHLVKLKKFSELRERLSEVGQELGLKEEEIMRADTDATNVVEQHLSPEEVEGLAELRTVSEQLRTIFEYLRPMEEQAQPDDQSAQIAA